MTDTAIDNDFDDAEQDYHDRLDAALDEIITEPVAGGLAYDLVTRQPLFVREQVADDLATYYDAEGFDLATYKMHPYLPVDADDAVFECVFISDITAEGLADWGSAKTYDYPRGRLAAIPVDQAWRDVEVGSL